mgnify:CR=1 FL=1
MRIRVELPKNRWERGYLTLVGTDFGCFCYGKADGAAAAKVGNPTRSPLQRNGDTPLGKYVGMVQGAPWGTSASRLRSYGPHRTILLYPTGGDALLAMKNGRSGLAIHGGDLASDGRGFRPTHGCIRLSNYYQAALLVYLDASGERQHEVAVVEMASEKRRLEP